MPVDLLQYQALLRTRIADKKRQVWDAPRRKWLVLTPEELVRQLSLHYLLANGCKPNLVRTELSMSINSRPKRADIVLFDASAKPLLLVECKAATIPLDEAVLFQALDYNRHLKVPFCMLTNGISTLFFALNYDSANWQAIDATDFFSAL